MGKREKIFISVLLIILFFAGVFVLIYTGILTQIFNSNQYTQIIGKVVGYETRSDSGIDPSIFYLEIVEYELNGEKHIYKDNDGTSIVRIGSDYILRRNEITGEISSGEPKDIYFPLLFLFIFVLCLIMFIVLFKVGEKFFYIIMKTMFLLIPFTFILYFICVFKTWDYLYIITQLPVIAILPLPFFLFGCFLWVSPIIYIFQKPYYIEMKLTEIKEDDTGYKAYFYQNNDSKKTYIYFYYKKNLNLYNLNLFEIGKTYKVNMARLGKYGRSESSEINLNVALRDKDFEKTD